MIRVRDRQFKEFWACRIGQALIGQPMEFSKDKVPVGIDELKDVHGMTMHLPIIGRESIIRGCVEESMEDFRF